MAYKDPAKQRAYLRRRKQEIRAWVRSTKEDHRCKICPQNDPDLLDYHHRDPATKCFKISDAEKYTFNKDRIRAEIAKCDLICCDCHRKLHRPLLCAA